MRPGPADAPFEPRAIFLDESAAAQGDWSHVADVVVVGTGAAALSAAVAAVAGGSTVIILEAAETAGGTTARSGGGSWIPNNRHMRERGIADAREDAIRYMAMYSFRHLYDPDDRWLGLSRNAHELLCAFYDNASPAVEALEALGALMMRGDVSNDYWEDAGENRAPAGRTIFPMIAGDTPVAGVTHPATTVTPEWTELGTTLAGGRIGGGGPIMISQMIDWLKARSVAILPSHRVSALISNRRRDVVGVEALRADGTTVAVRARRAVHFGSGGFAHNPELRLAFLRGPAYGGCATPTNQGDFLTIAMGAGARLGNMANGWNTSVILDDAFADDHPLRPVLLLAGDSMFVVNKYGVRVGNEKRNYADRLEVQHDFDPTTREWRNLVLFVVFDDRMIEHCGGFFPFPAKDGPAEHVCRGDTVEELADSIRTRLKAFGGKIGGFQIDQGFEDGLKATLEDFNRFAQTGVDAQFGRGSTAYDLQWHLRGGGASLVATNTGPNKTMHPLEEGGRLYAVPLLKGHADTNGGPVINARSQVLSASGLPIPGLYGAGNCIASPSGRAYWGAGTTLGLALTFGWIAGRNAATEPVKALDQDGAVGGA